MPDSQQSLTQQEAEERAALLDVQAYDIAVDLTALPSGTDVRSTSRITFTCTRPGTSTFLDCCGDVVSATLNGQPLPSPEHSRIALEDLQGENVVVVESVQSHTLDGEGVHKAVDPADGEVYVWMSFEPDEARQVWACFDQPDLKAPHAFTVTAPAAWTVVSNSGGPEVEDVDVDAARRWTFPATPPLSTYNPVVLAGPFHEIRRSIGGHDLGLFARRSLESVLERDAEELFTITSQGLAFYAEAFDMPFPQEKYDQVFVPELGGAMENYGCVTWSDAFLTRVPPTPAEQELLAAVTLHEMAHMWFGNIVTMRWWDDLWLNEAFAEFAANWCLVSATRHSDAWARHLADDKQQAYLADQGPRSHAIRQPVPDVAAAAASFDAITYPKGASVLDQLKTYLGEETFRHGMAAYFARHAWGNTALQDLVSELAEASGRDLDTWRHKWLEEAGIDLLVLERGSNGFELVATPAPGTDSPRPHVVGVGAYRRTPGGLERTAFETVEITGERTSVDLPDDADLYLANDDDLTFAKTRPDGDSRPALFELAAELPTAVSRGVAVSTVRDMLISGEAGAREVVDCLVRVLRTETAPTCVEPYLGFATRVAELWTPEGDREEVGGLISGLCREYVDQGRYEQVALRAWSRTASSDDLAQLEAAAASDTDLRWRVLVRQAQLGNAPSDRELDRLVTEDSDPDAWVRALTVRTAVASAEAKEGAWTALVGERKVPISSVGAVATAFWRPGQEELLAPYAERYVEAVPTLHQGGMISAMVYAGVLFPLFGIDEAYLDRAVEASREAVPVVQARLEERADEVRRMLVARSA